MVDGEWWYKNKDGAKTGPADKDLLEALWLAGDMDGLTLVWKEGMADFVPLGEVAELRALLAQADDDDDDVIDEDQENTVESGPTAKAQETGETGKPPPQKRIGMGCKELWDLQWASATTEDGTTYYANKYSYESSWTAPVQPTSFDEEDASMVQPPWMLCWTATGEKFWLNTETSERVQSFESTQQDTDMKEGPEASQDASKPAAVPAGEGEAKEAGGAAQAGEKRKRKRKNKPKWKKPKINTYVYVQGLPEDTTVEEVAEFFSKFGVLRPDESDGKTPKVKLYTDEGGKLKGDGRVGFLKEASVPLVLQLADGSNFREGSHPLKVSVATFQMKGGAFVERETAEEKKKRAQAMAALRKKERVLDWGADDGIDDGRGLRIVILKNVFDHEEMIASADAALTLQFEIETEAKKIGEVEKVTIFERNPEGVVAIKFKQAPHAEECIGVMNGRFFGGKKITCDFWDGATNYVVKETEEEEAKRLEAYGDWLEAQGSDNDNGNGNDYDDDSD